MKILIPCLLLLLSFTKTICQNKTTDSLMQQLAIAKDDSGKLSTLAKLAFTNIWSNPEQALLFAQQELLLARKAKIKKAETLALWLNASVLSILGDYSHSINFYLQSIKLSE